MSEDEFELFIHRHGGDPARWPADRRAAAAALLARSGRARARLGEMAALEALLHRAHPRPAADDALAARRMATRAMRAPQPRRPGWLLRFGRPAGLGLAAALTLAAGLAIGLHRGGGAAEGVDESEVVATALQPGGRDDAGGWGAGNDVD